jgi:hypothetical protein
MGIIDLAVGERESLTTSQPMIVREITTLLKGGRALENGMYGTSTSNK